MKVNFLHHIAMLGIFIISIASNAQNETLAEEENLNFQRHFFEALKQKAINNYGKAIESLEKCAEIDGESKAVEFEMAKNHLLLKNYIPAEIFINKALKRDPNNVYMLQHKVKLLKEQGRLKEAIVGQKQLIEIQPNLSDNLVLLYIQNKNYDLAENLIKKIHEDALSTTKTNFYTSFLEKRKKPLKKVKKTNEPNTDNANIETLRKLYKEKGEFGVLKELLSKEAIEEDFDLLNTDSEAALELFPAQPIIYKMNGLSLFRLGKYNESISVLRTGIEFVIDDISMEADFYELLSKNYLSLNNQPEYIKYKQKAEALRNNNK
jgi:predicted Zn-dependent protease